MKHVRVGRSQRSLGHRLLLVALYITGGFVVLHALVEGGSFYSASPADRAHHADYRALRPAGDRGHAYGVAGSALLLLLLLYSARKRWSRLTGWGSPAVWLNVHICFGILGPLLIVLHSSFKVGGLIAVSFWSMIAVAGSGAFGRWLYVQIPRNRAGYELSRKEIADLEREARERVEAETNPRRAARLARRRSALERRIRRLDTVRRLFHWWHVVHKPFAIIMLAIMALHIAVALSLGYRWVF